jgi:hypothetical protein
MYVQRCTGKVMTFFEGTITVVTFSVSGIMMIWRVAKELDVANGFRINRIPGELDRPIVSSPK